MDLVSADRFEAKDGILEARGSVSSDQRQMIQGLLGDALLVLEVSCKPDSEIAIRKMDRVLKRRKCSICITIFGPMDLFGEIGSWFEEYDICLQDPDQLGVLDVKYCNPHRPFFCNLADCHLLSEQLKSNMSTTRYEEIVAQPDLLDILSSHSDLEEAAQPTAIQTILKRYAPRTHAPRTHAPQTHAP